MPLRSCRRRPAPIELWDSGEPVSAHAGDTLQRRGDLSCAALGALQINQKSEHAALSEGERIVVPRYLGAKSH